MKQKHGETIIEIQGLNLEYKTKQSSVSALENINLEVKQGEFICLLGPSGCGKSTLLKTMAGYIAPTSGRILMEGKPIMGPDWNRGVVFQSPTLYPWLNVKKNVAFGPKMKGLAPNEIEKISHHFLEQVDLLGFGDKRTFELSGGMKQRVALARVLANYPKMILMDEPLGALDALTRSKMQSLVRNIWRENKSTVLFITHDVDEALSLGTRVLVMSKRPGRILKEFNVDFTDKIFKAHSDRVIYSEAFFNLKKEILEIINNQIEEE